MSVLIDKCAVRYDSGMGERQEARPRPGERDGDVRGSSGGDIYDESIFHRMVMNPSNVL